VGLRRCPHLLNHTAKLGKTQQKRKKQARSTHVLVYPRLEEEGRSYHFPSYTSSEIQQANKAKSALSKLENEKKGER
jgi:hypothetical protein